MTFKLHADLVRDGHYVGDFPLSALLLIKDEAYPWCVLVPRVANIKDAYQLTEDDHIALTRESRCLSSAMMAAFKGEKMNVAALGNMTPQLHVHHIVRFKSDPAWPGPIWGVQPLTPMTDTGLSKRLSKIVTQLKEGRVEFQPR